MSSSYYSHPLNKCPSLGQRIVVKLCNHGGDSLTEWQDGTVIETATLREDVRPSWAVKIRFIQRPKRFWNLQKTANLWVHGGQIVATVDEAGAEILKLEAMMMK